MRWLLATSVATVALLFGFPGDGYADIIPGLFYTGVDNANVLLPDGSVDPHYKLIMSCDPSTPGPDAIVASIRPSQWLANGPLSKWLSPLDDTEASAPSLDKCYVYQLQFDLTGLDPNSAVIVGQYRSDNSGSIFLNGVDTGFDTPTPTTFQAIEDWVEFTLSGGFLPGINTLEFRINNALDANSIPSPTGVRVEISGTAQALPQPQVVPEPSTLALFAVGTLALLGYGWRRRKQVA